MSKRKIVAALLTAIVLSLSTPVTAAPRFYEGSSVLSRLTRILQKFFGTGSVKSSASEMSIPKP